MKLSTNKLLFVLLTWEIDADCHSAFNSGIVHGNFALELSLVVFGWNATSYTATLPLPQQIAVQSTAVFKQYIEDTIDWINTIHYTDKRNRCRNTFTANFYELVKLKKDIAKIYEIVQVRRMISCLQSDIPSVRFSQVTSFGAKCSSDDSTTHVHRILPFKDGIQM